MGNRCFALWQLPQRILFLRTIVAGHITSLRFQKKNKDRVNVYLDEVYTFALPAVEAAKLRKGQFLSDAEIAALRTLDLEAKAFDRAIQYLAVRPRSEWEVRQKLQRYRTRDDETLTEIQIDSIVQRLKSHNYISDQAFAHYWVEQRNRFKPMSPRALRYELRRKGVDANTAERVIEAETEPEQAALDAARQRAYRWYALGEEAFRQKMIAFLQRRGFRWDVVRDVVQQVWQERETE